MVISIIFAMNADRIIGNKGELPWYLPSDLQRFKALTTGKPVIMGRKTFESILARNGKPLPHRENLVITSNVAYWQRQRIDHPRKYENCMFLSSLADAITVAKPEPEVFIIGGAEIYAQALPIANRMYFTQVAGRFEGDIKFPLLNMNSWETTHDELITADNHPYAFSILERSSCAAQDSTVAGADLVNPTFAAKRGGYGDTIAEIIRAGICPFCPETFLWHPWPILQRAGDWFITRIGWPYKNAEHHLLIIGNRHITSDIEMTSADDNSVRTLTRWAVDTLRLEGWGRISRSGITARNGASVCHLHFHLIQSQQDAEGKAIPVRFPIG